MAKKWVTLLAVLSLGALCLPALLAQNSSSGPTPAMHRYQNPKPFDNFAAPVSSTIAFLFSQRGQSMLKASPHPVAPFLLKVGGVETTATGTGTVRPAPPAQNVIPNPRQALVPIGILPQPNITPLAAPTVNAGCGTVAGTKFNLEPPAGTPPAPFALPQNEQTVDAIVGAGTSGADLVVEGANDYRALFGALGSSVTGYYVLRSGAACAPVFEGGAPSLPDPLNAGSFLFGGGDPVVRRDATRGAFFEADLRFNGGFPGGTTAITVQRTTVANLNNTVNCPNGTHNTDAAARNCWPTGVVINPLPQAMTLFFNDKPHMAVDERSSGTGAGNVYVTATEFDFSPFTLRNFSRIFLVACTNTLSACSAPTFISDADLNTQFSHVSVRPDGFVTVSYEEFASTGVQIKFVTCAPASAPATPSCNPPTLVTTETQPLIFLGANDFRVATYAKHDHRTNGANTETFVVWERCHVPASAQVLGGCPKSDVVVSESVSGGPFSAPALVDTAPKDQFFSWINVDRVSGTVNITYYTAESDYYSHFLQVKLAQIAPGGFAPESIASRLLLQTARTDPASDLFLVDFFYGDYIGVIGVADAANTLRRAYVGYTYNISAATYGSVIHAEQNNYLTRVDY